MENSFPFVLAVLVCFRLAQLIALDDGPLDVCFRFRVWSATKNAQLSKLVSCPYCIGFWFAFALTFTLTCPDLPIPIYARDLVLNGIAIAGGQAFLQGWIDRR